jgi:hypothetical protein
MAVDTTAVPPPPPGYRTSGGSRSFRDTAGRCSVGRAASDSCSSAGARRGSGRLPHPDAAGHTPVVVLPTSAPDAHRLHPRWCHRGSSIALFIDAQPWRISGGGWRGRDRGRRVPRIRGAGADGHAGPTASRGQVLQDGRSGHLHRAARVAGLHIVAMREIRSVRPALAIRRATTFARTSTWS